MRLAICITVKNRSCIFVNPEDSLQFLHHVAEKIEDCSDLRIEPLQTKTGQLVLPLFPRMLKSLANQKKEEDDWVVVVVDYKSTDVDVKEMLEVELGDRIPWHLETVDEYAFFDRGGGLAKAAQIAESKYNADALFFCDADLLFLSRDVFDTAMISVSKGQFYYPIFFAFATTDHSKGFWRETSYGNFACTVSDYKKTEGWYHNISWGWEDRALADSIPAFKKDRDMVRGFFHQWHPMQWEFRVKEYPVKTYVFRDAAVKKLPAT
jgi:glycosyltransferase involved in cell wall biosynthesis